MQTIKFTMKGRKADIEATLKEIAELPDVASVEGDPRPLVGSVLTRGKQNQIEIFECVVAVALNLTANVLYDGLKKIVAAIAEKQNIQSEEIEDDSGKQ